MGRDQVSRMRWRLGAFVRRFDRCIKTKPSRRHLRTYVGGQVSDLPRKSVEPIALQAGVPPRTLQEFLGLHRWDEAAVRRRVQQIVQREHGDPNAITVVDETGCPKKGEKTAGVQRQYCGASRKIDTCVITIHLGFATRDFHTLVDGDLYLPKETWYEDRERCRAAGIPDTVVYRLTWRIALGGLSCQEHGERPRGLGGAGHTLRPFRGASAGGRGMADRGPARTGRRGEVLPLERSGRDAHGGSVAYSAGGPSSGTSRMPRARSASTASRSGSTGR